MRPVLSAACLALCLAAAPGARATNVTDAPRFERETLLATLVADASAIARPFELAAMTMRAVFADLPAGHEDPDPCAEW